MNKLRCAMVLAATLACGAACAQTAPPDPLAPGSAAETPAIVAPAGVKPARPALTIPPREARKRGPAGALTVTITNKRSVGLVELEAGPAGGELKKVQGALAFGRRAVAHLPRAKNCLYDIKGHFADEADTDLTGVDLCKDKAINLTDE